MSRSSMRIRPMRKAIGRWCCAVTVLNMWRIPQAISGSPLSIVHSLPLFSMMRTTNPPCSMLTPSSGRSTKRKQLRSTRFRRAFLPFHSRRSLSMCSSATRKPTTAAEEHRTPLLQPSFITSSPARATRFSSPALRSRISSARRTSLTYLQLSILQRSWSCSAQDRNTSMPYG